MGFVTETLLLRVWRGRTHLLQNFTVTNNCLPYSVHIFHNCIRNLLKQINRFSKTKSSLFKGKSYFSFLLNYVRTVNISLWRSRTKISMYVLYNKDNLCKLRLRGQKANNNGYADITIEIYSCVYKIFCTALYFWVISRLLAVLNIRLIWFQVHPL